MMHYKHSRLMMEDHQQLILLSLVRQHPRVTHTRVDTLTLQRSLHSMED